jgi:predicted small secreted protein
MKKKLSLIILCLLSCVFVLAACTVGGGGVQSGGENEENGGEEPVHEHEYGEYIREIPATCTEDGVLGHFTCMTCGMNFDKNKKELESLVIERDWPHEFYDGVCEKCGEELVYTNGLKFTLSADKSYYSLTGIGTLTETDIIIPQVYNNLPVTEIGSAVFRRNADITSVVIPYTVTKIGSYAFSDCASLESVVFEEESEL